MSGISLSAFRGLTISPESSAHRTPSDSNVGNVVLKVGNSGLKVGNQNRDIPHVFLKVGKKHKGGKEIR